jgi:hypothetical protein
LRGSAAFQHGKATGVISYHAPCEKSTSHCEGSDKLPRTEGNSRPRHAGAAKSARDWRLEPTVYELCSFRLKIPQSPQRRYKGRFLGAAVVRPRRLRAAGNDTAAAPVGETVSRGATNLVGPIAGLCGLPTRHGIGPGQLPRTEREKFHARRGKRPSTTHRRK